MIMCLFRCMLLCMLMHASVYVPAVVCVYEYASDPDHASAYVDAPAYDATYAYVGVCCVRVALRLRLRLRCVVMRL